MIKKRTELLLSQPSETSVSFEMTRICAAFQ